MNVPYCYYQSLNMKRKLGPEWHKQPGCQHQPFFNIPLENIVIDELHLMLRVMDRLQTGLILEVIDWDEVKDFFLSVIRAVIKDQGPGIFSGQL